MNKGLKNQLIPAIVGALITGIISIGIFVVQINSFEEKTVETLAGYFESVNENMSYDDVVKTIYENYKKLEKENEDLKNRLGKVSEQYNIDEINQNALLSAEKYANTANYAMAIATLTSLTNKTPEIELCIDEYTQKYESYITEQVNKMQTEEKLDEAILLLNESLNVVPNSNALKNKLKDIENSYPQKMLDVVPAYQAGGNPYKEYSYKNSGGTENFSMGGVKYTNGMTFSADSNIFNDVSWAIYNLNGQFNTLEFTAGHVDGTFNGDKNILQVFYDGELKEEIPLSPDMLPQEVLLDVTGVKQLKMQVHSSGGDNPVYGVGNPIIK